ncbi:hypothetical protein [Pedobacter alpinus]|uniref:Uncharacterized protein n=1 Tax=Pedobacter alpinus TaxID=1590643 RepID=A0ABW5TPZ2_9SPHI
MMGTVGSSAYTHMAYFSQTASGILRENGVISRSGLEEASKHLNKIRQTLAKFGKHWQNPAMTGRTLVLAIYPIYIWSRQKTYSAIKEAFANG